MDKFTGGSIADSFPKSPMSLMILATKLYMPPPRPQRVMRARLMTRLNGILTSRLTLITAPAGFGKTTVISEWLEAHPETASSWLSLDEEDNDPNRFWVYVIAALQRLDPAIGQHTYGLLQLTRPPTLETLVTSLINEIPATLALIFVLDDYHVITNSAIHASLNFLLDHLPPAMHLVITSRTTPPLNLARWRVRAHLTELLAQDLRFTTHEAADFLNSIMGLELSAAEIALLETRTEGWIAGLQLAALSLQHQEGKTTIAHFRGDNRYVLDYLMAEVMAQQPPEVQTFLSQTAILPRLTADLCNAVTGRTDSKQLLAYLEQANLFLIPLDQQRQWYRYHHLFAEFLRHELKLSHPQPYHQRAAHWLEQQGWHDEAIQQALAAPDIDLAVHLISQAAERVIESGQLLTLLNWLEALPPTVIQQNSDLATYYGWVLWLRGQIEVARQYTQTALAQLIADSAPLTRAKALSLQACLLVTDNNLAAADAVIAEALALFPSKNSFFYGLTLLMWGEVLQNSGQGQRASEVYQEASEIGQATHSPFMVLGAIVNLTQIWQLQGRRYEIIALCQQTLEQYADNQSAKPMLELIYGTLAHMAYQADDLALAYEYLTQAIHVSQQQYMVIFTLFSKQLATTLELSQGNLRQAEQNLRDLHHIVKQNVIEPYLPVLKALEIDFYLSVGQLTAIQPIIEQFHLSPTATPQPHEELLYLSYARYLLAVNRPYEARQLLHQLAELTQTAQRYYHLLLTQILQTLTHLALQQPDRALIYLEQAIRFAATQGYRRVFINEGTALAPLLTQLHPIAPQFISDLLGRLHHGAPPAPSLAPAPPAPFIATLIEPLSDREIEILRLIAQGDSNRAIAQKLILALGTVKKHLNNIFGKLGVTSRTQAIVRARELHLVP